MALGGPGLADSQASWRSETPNALQTCAAHCRHAPGLAVSPCDLLQNLLSKVRNSEDLQPLGLIHLEPPYSFRQR